MKETLQELGLKTLPGDDAFYYEHRDGKLMGLNLSHVDDFTIAGDTDFVKRIVTGIKERFTVSKVEEDKFRFTGLDVKAKNGRIEISIENYADSAEEIKEIRIYIGSLLFYLHSLNLILLHGYFSWLNSMWNNSSLVLFLEIAMRFFLYIFCTLSVLL